MIWVIVSSRSCFCWLCRASPSSATKNIINLIFSIDHLVMSMCTVISCIIGRVCLLWPVCSLGKTVSLCPASFCTPWPNLPITPGISWLPTFAFQHHMRKRTSFFGVSSRKSYWVFIELFNFSFFGINGWGTDLDSCDAEWFALEMNWDHSVIFETTPKYCISNSFVDYESIPFFPKGFLPTVVDIIIIWIKLGYSSPF